MRTRVLFILMVGCIVAAVSHGEEGGKGDKDKLQGTWQVVSQEADGEKLPAEFSKHFTFTFKDDSAHFRGDKFTPGADLLFSFTLDPNKGPKWIDLNLAKSPDNKGLGTTSPGIYSLEGDELKICYSDKTRPAEFATKGQENTTFMVLKRKKAE